MTAQPIPQPGDDIRYRNNGRTYYLYVTAPTSIRVSDSGRVYLKLEGRRQRPDLSCTFGDTRYLYIPQADVEIVKTAK